jgi:hypothetical protein
MPGKFLGIFNSCQPLVGCTHLTSELLQLNEGVMARCEMKGIRSELVQLIEQQMETIAKETCNQLTGEELREYDSRNKRIAELYEALHSLDSAA